MFGKKIGLIGAGNMAEALLRGVLEGKVADPTEIRASDPDPARRHRLHQRFGIETTDDNLQVADHADLLILAIKPQTLTAVAGELGGRSSGDLLLVSVLAGVELGTLRSAFPQSPRIVRAMPNLPAVVLAGATGLCSSEECKPDDVTTAKRIFDSVGETVVLAEPLLNAVTGLSGSGPAYVMVMIEALADGGVQMGLPREVAAKLAAQTVLGAARLLGESGEHPAVIKDRVTSPGGTTIAGLNALEAEGFRYAVMRAVRAATERAFELGALATTTPPKPGS